MKWYMQYKYKSQQIFLFHSSGKPDLLSLLSASKPDNRFLKSGKPNSRGNFLPQTGLPVIKTGKPVSRGTLLEPTGIPAQLIRQSVFNVSSFWSQPEFRLVQTRNPVSGVISHCSSSFFIRHSGSCSLSKNRFLSLIFHSKIHHYHSIQIDSYKLFHINSCV